MAKYTVQKDGFILGNHYRAGETIDLDPAQAKYLIPPMGDGLAPAAQRAAASKPAPTKAEPKAADNKD